MNKFKVFTMHYGQDPVVEQLDTVFIRLTAQGAY